MRRQGMVALGLGAVYSFAYIALSVLRHESYHSFGLDLGLFDQVFWNTTQGRPFESTMSQALPVPHSLLGDHFSPIFGLLVPFYIYEYGFEGVNDAEWVVLDYAGTNPKYDITEFHAQVASVEAAGFDEVASGYGLALLRKR